MNREIKFRAWNKKLKIMCYDNEDDSADYWDGYNSSNIEMINHLLKYNKDGIYIYMQCAGIKDKNGVEIYEGDILKNIATDFKYEVIFRDSKYNLICRYEDIPELEEEMSMYNFLNRIPMMFEVIGNIYENEVD